MDLSSLKSLKGTKRKKKRLGRGIGSGKGGHTVGRGAKGQKARSKVSVGFEGGQTPLYKRLPQIGGFKNPRSKKILSISLAKLNLFKEGSSVTPESLLERKIFKKLPKHGVKILASGELKKTLKLSGFLFSKKAKKKIEESGSTIK